MECSWPAFVSTQFLDAGSFSFPLIKSKLSVPAYGCANPPIPQTNLHLHRLDYVNDTVLEFGANVMYACEPGHFFDELKDLEGFNLTCQEDGTWSSHLPWKFCVHPDGTDGALIIKYKKWQKKQ